MARDIFFMFFDVEVEEKCSLAIILQMLDYQVDQESFSTLTRPGNDRYFWFFQMSEKKWIKRPFDNHVYIIVRLFLKSRATLAAFKAFVRSYKPNVLWV